MKEIIVIFNLATLNRNKNGYKLIQLHTTAITSHYRQISVQYNSTGCTTKYYQWQHCDTTFEIRISTVSASVRYSNASLN